MIVDFHTHIFPPSVLSDRRRYLDDGGFRLLYSAEKSRVVDHSMLLSDMQEGGIDLAVVMAFPWENEEHCEEQHTYFKGVMEQSRRKVFPFGLPPVSASADVEGWVERISNDGFSGIGEIAFYKNGMNETSFEYLERVFRAAGRFGLPVCLHVSEPVGHHYHGKYDSRLGDLYSLIEDHRELPMILSHWGGGMVFYELMPRVADTCSRVWYDSAASPLLYKQSVYEIAASIAGPGKILFGSDYPLIGFRRALDPIVRSDLGKKEKLAITGRNALGLLKIEL